MFMQPKKSESDKRRAEKNRQLALLRKEIASNQKAKKKTNDPHKKRRLEALINADLEELHRLQS
jgi:hypothetical protein